MNTKLRSALGRMADARRFFVYLLEWDADTGKYSKRPTTSIKTAKLTFEDALSGAMKYREAGRHATVGMRIDDGLFFVDVDQLPSDFVLDSRANEICALLPSGLFMEWSSSKRGLHIIGRLSSKVLHACRNTEQHLEFYTEDRGVALNIDAEPVGSMDVVANVSALIERFFAPRIESVGGDFDKPRADWKGPTDDEELIKRALNAKDGAGVTFGGKASFGQLWRGEVEQNSEHDLALASRLAFWTGCDAPRIKRLMLRSGLKREKWISHRTYLHDLTIGKACSGCKNVYVERVSLLAEPEIPAPRVRNAAELMSKKFKPVQWAIRDILPEGVTILSGDPKIGKSWLVYQMCLAIAGGVPIWAGRASELCGDALYLDLEGNDRRLQRRLEKLLTAFPKEMDTSKLHYATEWPRAEVGVDELAKWLRQHPNCRIVVIDTVSAFRDNDPGRKSAYAHDYVVGEMLKPLAREFSCAIVLVMHNRKQAAGDVLQRVSGTQGMTGSVDNVLVLERTRGDLDASLSIDGRDIENPAQLALSFNEGPWRCIGMVADVQRSKERGAVIEAIKAQKGAATLSEICDHIPDKRRGAIKTMLSKMVKSGELKNDNGIYTLPTDFIGKLPPLPILA